MGMSLKTDEKNKNWMEKKNDRRNLKDAVNKDDTKLEGADGSNIMFIDLILKVASTPAQVKLHSASATMDIPDNSNIKGIFAAAGTQMHVLVTVTTTNTDTITIVIPKFQEAMLSKKGGTLVDQVGNIYI